MADNTATVASLRTAMATFVSERDWQQFHSPKNLVMGLAVEAAELMEHYLWVDNSVSLQVSADPATKVAIGEEMADVACYLLAMANAIGVDLSDAIADKLIKNARKYPAEQYRGRYKADQSPT